MTQTFSYNSPTLKPTLEKPLAEKIDGNLDVEVDTAEWSEEKKWSRLQLYLVFVDPSSTIMTSSGLQLQYGLRFLHIPKPPILKVLREYLKDGKCCVAKKSCKRCVEINSVRPPGAGYPPFSCIIEAEPNRSRVRPDGSQICACCSVLAQTKCHAWGAHDLRWKALPEIPEEASEAEITTDEELFGDGTEQADD